MATIPLRWLGASRRKALHAWVAARCAEWLRKWSAADDGLTLEIHELDEARAQGHPFDPRWHLLREPTGALHVKASVAVFEAIGCRLVGAAEADACGIAAGVGRRAMIDLAAAVLQSPIRSDFTALPGPPEAAQIGPRHGAMGFRLALDATQVELYLDAAACDLIVPAAAPTGIALSARRSAIRPAMATFDIVLDLGQVPVLESIALKPGDIIKTTTPIDAVIHARTPRSRPIFAGALVASERHRAIRLSGQPLTREHPP